MNEELKNVNEEIENTDIEVFYDDAEVSKNGGLSKLLVGGLVGVAAIAGAVAFKKTKNKREEKKIEKLRKKGYVITKPDEVIDVEDEEVKDVEDDK